MMEFGRCDWCKKKGFLKPFMDDVGYADFCGRCRRTLRRNHSKFVARWVSESWLNELEEGKK